MKLISLSLFLLALQSDNYTVIDNNVNQDGASFKYHSEILKDKKGLWVFNFLKNNDKYSLLSIKWEAADLFYIGKRQLSSSRIPCSLTDRRDIRDPFEYPNTPIVWGNGGRRSYPGSCFIERSKVPKYTAYKGDQTISQRDENGKILQEIHIASFYNEELEASIIKFDVKGGSDIVFRQPLGSSFDVNTNCPPNNKLASVKNWSAEKNASLANILKMYADDDESVETDSIVSWLDSNDSQSGEEYIICKNPGIEDTKFELICYGSKFNVIPVRMVSLNSSKKLGTLGFSSNILSVK